jgi:hypothetical protein
MARCTNAAAWFAAALMVIAPVAIPEVWACSKDKTAGEVAQAPGEPGSAGTEVVADGAVAAEAKHPCAHKAALAAGGGCSKEKAAEAATGCPHAAKAAAAGSGCPKKKAAEAAQVAQAAERWCDGCPECQKGCCAKAGTGAEAAPAAVAGAASHP